MAFVAVAAAAVAGCAGSGARARGLRLAAAGRSTAAIAELRVALAEDPADREVRAALGRALLREGLPGAALRELTRARRLGDRGGAVLLAALRAERGRERLRAGDPGGWRDLAAAGELDPRRAPPLAASLAGALVDAGILAWGAGDRDGARGLWRRARKVNGGRGAAPEQRFAADVEAAMARPEAVPPRALAAVARRVAGVAGVRVARPLLEAAARRGTGDARLRTLLAEARRSADPLAGEPPASETSPVAPPATTAPAVAGAAAADGPAPIPSGPVPRPVVGPAAVRLPRAHRPAQVPGAPPGCAPADLATAELALVQRALRRDLALADRVARRYADLVPAAACRAGVLVEVFARAGRLDRALEWAEEAIVEAPERWWTHLAAARIAARLQDAWRAELHLQHAEYWSPRRGAPSLELAALYRELGAWVPALGAARSALALAEGRDRWEAFEAIIEAARGAGRARDAARAWAAYRRELPRARHAAVARRLGADVVAGSPSGGAPGVSGARTGPP